VRLAVTVAVILLAACAVNNDKYRAQLESRARFDLQCDAIEVTPLEELNTFVSSYGVEGCDSLPTSTRSF